MRIGNDWDSLLESEFCKNYYLKLQDFLKQEYDEHTVFPPRDDIFNALKYTPYADVRVVILGQDPYHGKGQAHGLAFSVKRGVKPPPSLRNIFKELESDVGINQPSHGELTDWAKSGVLLLNTVLTVREGEANSHKKKGWETFTDSIIALLDQKDSPVVFLLWGKNAESKRSIITNPLHKVLVAAHPSPLSAHNGFFGCKHFSQTNDFLEKCKFRKIKWQIS